MVHSTPVLGSSNKLGPIAYVFQHCLPTGFQSCWEAFYYWSLSLRDDTREYESFDFLSEEEKLDNVRLDFWYSITESEVLDREFLNELVQMVEDVETGKVETVPFSRIKDALE